MSDSYLKDWHLFNQTQISGGKTEGTAQERCNDTTDPQTSGARDYEHRHTTDKLRPRQEWDKTVQEISKFQSSCVYTGIKKSTGRPKQDTGLEETWKEQPFIFGWSLGSEQV